MRSVSVLLSSIAACSVNNHSFCLSMGSIISFSFKEKHRREMCINICVGRNKEEQKIDTDGINFIPRTRRTKRNKSSSENDDVRISGRNANQMMPASFDQTWISLPAALRLRLLARHVDPRCSISIPQSRVFEISSLITENI